MTSVVFISYGSAFVSAVVAAAALLRAPKSPVNWAFVAGMALLSGEAVCIGLSAQSADLAETARWEKTRHVLMAFLPGVWLVFSLIYSRGNAGQFLKRWRYLLILAVLVPAIMGLGFRDVLVGEVRTTGRMASSYLQLGWAGLALHGILMVASVLILMNLEQTFTASVGTMRWRLKYMVLGLGLLFGVRVYTCSQALLYRAVSLSLPVVDVVGLILACGLVTVSLFRAKQFEMEIYPSHAVLQGSLTFILAGCYLLVVGIFAKVVSAIGGDAAFSIKAFLILVAIVGLSVLLLSDRIQQRMKLAVSRHFLRPMYDYRKAWSAFTERTTSVMDKIEFCRAVTKLIAETFGSLSVTIWLVDPQKQQLAFATSTLLDEDKARILIERYADTGKLLKALRDHPYPVDIDSGKEGWLADLQGWNPDFFRKGSNRVCVPLISAGDVLGMIALADRVSGLRFSVADLDLLKCIGDQVAASLRNLQLSEQVLRAKEMEAFQAMSTFFVHDLKNMAYTLSLMLQNMSEHFGDPAFREDALRSLSRSVSHLNTLISRFSSLRQGLQLKKVETDLNETVESALQSLGAIPGVRLEKELPPLPKLLIDSEQLQKVITNLVLNAKDAVGPQGEIKVRTSQQNGWAFVLVSDNGCGMSREFIDKSLFKPFQTTKKNGLGIGMFHSRMIVEAHRGRMEVESEKGQGTTFRVVLPMKTAEA